MTRYVIVGGGAAGFAAAEMLAQADSPEQVSLVTGERPGYYSRPGLAYYLAGEIPMAQLTPFHQDDLHRLGWKWVHAQVLRLEPGAHRLYLNNGQILTYDRLLLAVGATAMLPDIPGILLEGVVKLDDMDDAEKILRLNRRGSAAAVVGGGITALELVEGLAARGARVSYLIRGDRIWSSVLDSVESHLVEDRLKEDGVRIYPNTQVSEIFGDRQVTGLRTQEGQVFPCRMAAFAVGIRPRLDLARSGELAVKRGILVNEYFQTSSIDIFAAGDAAEIIDPQGGESLMESLWNPARQQGQIAAQNMSGARIPYRRTSPVNVTRLADLVTTIIGQIGPKIPEVDRDVRGIMRGDSEGWRLIPDALVAQTFSGGSRVRLYVAARTLCGALVMGDQTLSRPLQRLIEDQVDITPIRAALTAPDADLIGLILAFWKQACARASGCASHRASHCASHCASHPYFGESPRSFALRIALRKAPAPQRVPILGTEGPDFGDPVEGQGVEKAKSGETIGA